MNGSHLVSLIVRTKDRPHLLMRALKSIANQTYRPMEVVLVNDGGCDLEEKQIKGILEGITFTYIRLEKNTGRAHAGNMGIQNAQGDYIGFLDDDDELYPEHIDTLISVLESKDIGIAYSDVEMIINHSSPDLKEVVTIDRETFSRDFQYPHLIMANYIPFNSILFRKGVFKTIGMLDEDFDLYEDWELLIRMAERFPFHHVSKTTAIYNQWNKELQINQKNIEHMRAMHLKIMDKHRDKISNEFILELWEEKEKKDLIIAEKYALLEEKDVAIREEISRTPQFERILLDKNIKIEQLEKTMNLIQETLGWQMLEKIRSFREKYLFAGTRRRYIYDLLIRSIKYINIHGFRFFLRKAIHAYDKSKYFRGKNSPYATWIAQNEPDNATLKWQTELVREFKLKPRISIITPIYNPEENIFEEMIESVISQTYSNWELCLADASSYPYVREIIEKYLKNNEKIKVKYLDKNSGIAGNSNEALSLATGDFVALLDHDDVLSPFALFEVVRAINQNPDVDFIYSDRDKITYDGRRFDPFFKPGWSPDYLLSQNYLCHLNVFRKTLIDRISGFREGYEGSQDYDFVLRITELTDKIIHIPKILYHWRISNGSAAGNPEAKPYAYESAVKALQDAIQRRDWKGAVIKERFTRGLYKIRFQVNGNPGVTLILPLKNKRELSKKCIDSVLKHTTYGNYEILMVDIGSREETLKLFEQYKTVPKVKLLSHNKSNNFSDALNYAVSTTNSDFIVFLHDDVEILTGDWLEIMLGFAQRKETGAVGVKLLCPNGTIQMAGAILDESGNIRSSHNGPPGESFGYGGRILSIHNVPAVLAVCMMVRREVFDSIGGFDNQFPEIYTDIDFCLKLREKKYLIVYEPHAEVCHYGPLPLSNNEGISDKIRNDGKEAQALFKKWEHVLSNKDPYHNINLGFHKVILSEKVLS